VTPATVPTVQELEAARVGLVAARLTFWRLVTRILDGHPRGAQIGDVVRALPEPQRAAALALLAEFDGPAELHRSSECCDVSLTPGTHQTRQPVRRTPGTQ
jgi:hypothetical protein